MENSKINVWCAKKIKVEPKSHYAWNQISNKDREDEKKNKDREASESNFTFLNIALLSFLLSTDLGKKSMPTAYFPWGGSSKSTTCNKENLYSYHPLTR